MRRGKDLRLLIKVKKFKNLKDKKREAKGEEKKKGVTVFN
jgi:hypothetical protein